MNGALLLEVWDDVGATGEPLSSLIYAGPLGAEARRMLSPQARLRTTLAARSHFEAMTAYYRLKGWGEYTTNQPWDSEPYPPEWIEQQRQAGITLSAEEAAEPDGVLSQEARGTSGIVV
jgi:hypothetical protein